MLESDNGPPEKNETAQAIRDDVRNDLLTSGLYDWVPLIEVMQVANRHSASAKTDAVQRLALQTIKSLVEDGLMLIGDLPFPGEKFSGWDVPLDVAMERVEDLLVAHYAERDRWTFIVWMGLTPAGERLARDIEERARTD